MCTATHYCSEKLISCPIVNCLQVKNDQSISMVLLCQLKWEIYLASAAEITQKPRNGLYSTTIHSGLQTLEASSNLNSHDALLV